MKYFLQPSPHRRKNLIKLGLMLLIALLLPMQMARAATLTTTSVSVSDPRPSTTAVTYDFLTSGVTTSAIQCMRIEFDSQPDGLGGKPTGMDITNAALSGATDYIPTPGSWTVSNSNAAGVTSITFASGETPASAATRNIVLTGITNGNTAGVGYFMLVNTYNNTDCASSPVDNAIVQFIYTNGQAVSMSVDSTLAFSVAGVTGNGAITANGAIITSGLTTTSTTIPFGSVTSAVNKVAAQDLTVTTNVGAGFTVYTRYTGVPTSGSNTITDFTGTNAAPTTFSAAGTEAFGYTTEDSTLITGTTDRFTSSGGNKWAKFTTTNAEIVASNVAVSAQTTRVGFQAGVAATTEPGAYTTTVIYSAVPVY